MRRINRNAVLAAAGVTFALAHYLLMALPGLVSDQNSTVSVQPTHEARR